MQGTLVYLGGPVKRECYRTDPGGMNNILLPNGPPHSRFALPATRERCLSMPEIGEKERNYLFKEIYRLGVMT